MDEHEYIELIVRCEVEVRVAMEEPFDAGDVFDAVYSELAFNAELVDVHDYHREGAARPAMSEAQASGHIRRLFEKVLRV